MKALMYEGPRQMPLVEIPELSPLAGEVKIQVRYCGICGSDLHGYTGESGRKIPLCLEIPGGRFRNDKLAFVLLP